MSADSVDASDSPPWYSLSRDAVSAKVGATADGLTSDEAARRHEEYGPNRLPRAKSRTWWQIGLHQFQNPLIYILAIAAIVSFAIGEFTDSGFIVAVLLLNAIIGGAQEWQAERSSQALQQLLRTRATVVRDGETREIDGEGVVPGDIVLLESGYRVPADVRLLSTHGLEIDESALTGESAPVLKDESWSVDGTVPLGDRRNMAYAGTVVNRGRSRGIVVETGAETVVGRLAEDVTAVEGGKPPLIVRMERFTRVVGATVLVAAVVTALLGIFVRQYDAIEMFLFAVALAVSAIPEGLPVAMTVALGAASRRMAKVGVIVRRLVAVEGLGSCTMIATDKTGTLTANELTVTRVQLPDGTSFKVTGEGYAPEGQVLQDSQPPDPEFEDDLARVARAAVLCNEGRLSRRNEEWTWRGDPTDIALLALGQKLGWDRDAALQKYPQVDEIPFEPEYRFSATFHEEDSSTRVFVKGGPERVLEMCDTSTAEESNAELQARATELAKDGYRVLVVAEGTIDGELDLEAPPPEPSGLTFLGFLGMMDPLRSGVKEAIAAAGTAGINVTMVTGDHPETALAIARELELAENPSEVMTGTDLVDIDADSLQEVIQQIRVFARVSPEQKLQIVQAARSVGHFVAVTGDGVNDAPALRQANIGIAMGRMGTDVARDAAELVISDDNFATIVGGIEQGRVAYDNIRKVIYLLVSTGAGEVVLVLLSLAAGLPLPLLPAQILWLNLVTNGIQDVALAFEPKEDDVLRRPPRSPTERIFDQLMIERTVIAAAVVGIVGFGAFWWMIDQGWAEETARNHLLLLIVLFEIAHIGNARSETKSVLRLSPLKSPILLVGTTAAFLIHLAAMYLPLGQAVLGTAPVALETWVVLGSVALTLLVAIELHKFSWRRRKPTDSTEGEGS